MEAFVLFVTLFLLAGTPCFYWTTSRILSVLRPGASVLVATLISLACWWAADAAVNSLGPLIGPEAQINIIDLDLSPALEASRLDEYLLYALAHALALLPRLRRRVARP